MSSTLDSEILDSDILPCADWSHPDYIFEDNESWMLSLKTFLCLLAPPFPKPLPPLPRPDIFDYSVY